MGEIGTEVLEKPVQQTEVQPQTQKTRRSELHQPKTSLRVTGEVIDIGDIQKEPSWFPFVKQGVEGSSPVFSVVAVSGGEVTDQGTDPVKLVKTSPEHGRAYEIDLGRGVIWADRFGILYGSLGIKGNNLEDVYVDKDRYSPTGFKVHGLQDRPLLETSIRNSQRLREEAIETEKTELVIKPQELVIDGRRVSIDEFKTLLFQRAEKDIKEGVTRHGGFGSGGLNLKESDLQNIKSYLENSEFYFSVRALQVAERFRDLHQAKTPEEFNQLMTKVFDFVNQREKNEAQKQKREPQDFDATKPEDIERYFTQYLPQRLASNVARLHRAGFYHDFLTGHNISLAGSVYDLDSIKPQSDAESVEKDFADLLEGLNDVFYGRRSFGTFGHIYEKSHFAENFGPNFASKFLETFTRTYLEQREVEALFGKTSLTEVFDSSMDSLFEESAREHADYVRDNKTTVDEVIGQMEQQAEAEGSEFNFVDEVKEYLKTEIKLKLPYLFYNPPINAEQIPQTIQGTANQWLEPQVETYIRNRGLTNESLLDSYKKLVEGKLQMVEAV